MWKEGISGERITIQTFSRRVKVELSKARTAAYDRASIVSQPCHKKVEAIDTTRWVSTLDEPHGLGGSIVHRAR
jgi:hypothetical protein